MSSHMAFCSSNTTIERTNEMNECDDDGDAYYTCRYRYILYFYRMYVDIYKYTKMSNGNHQNHAQTIAQRYDVEEEQDINIQ